jgi:small subunit ribosomal protein S27e
MLHVREQRNLNWLTSEVIFMASNFLKVSCRDCGAEVVIFSRATSVVSCSVCGATLTAPSGGKADLIGCNVVEALE